jgi:hypothetical protein
MMVYGQGGLGKSTLGAQLAAHVWKTLGKKTRVVNADGGGTSNSHAFLVEKGIVDLWNIDMWDEKSLFYTLEMATKGCWPEDTREPNSPLLPPMVRWKECPSCKKDVGAKGFAVPAKCASCGTVLGAGTFCRTRTEYANGFGDVGAVIFEGFTSFGDLLLRRLRNINPEGGRSIKDGETTISAPGQQHYGDAQAYLAQYIGNTKTIPTNYVMWTGLENRGEDDGKPVYGPKGPGQALTTLCIPWFTDVIHLDGLPKVDKGSVVKDAEGREVLERKLFLAPHYPPDNKLFIFKAKTSAPLGGDMPTSITFPAEGNTMSAFLGLLEKARQKAGEGLLA